MLSDPAGVAIARCVFTSSQMSISGITTPTSAEEQFLLWVPQTYFCCNVGQQVTY